MAPIISFLELYIERADASENTMNGNLEFPKDTLLAMWRDLTSEPLWKHEELPPLLSAELTRPDLFEVGDSELARAQWLWSRRPKLALYASTALLAAGLCVTLSLAIAIVAWPETSMPKRVSEMIISLLALVAAIYPIAQRIGFVRWRREYELSIDRLIHTIHPRRR